MLDIDHLIHSIRLAAGSSGVVTAVSAVAIGIAMSSISLLLLSRARASLRAAQAAHSSSGQGSILVDRDARVLEANSNARRLIWPKLAPGDPLVLRSGIQELLADPEEQHHVLRMGTSQLLELSISERTSRSRIHGVRGIAVRDITEQRRGQRHLVRLAHYDSLTGLGNRRLFVDQLETTIARAGEGDHQIALLYLDLDRFKDVNDTLGHGAGDDLLRTLANRFEGELSKSIEEESDKTINVYRLAGDEFAIIATRFESIQAIEDLATRVLDLITEPMTVADRSIASSGSVGIALYPDHAQDVEDLVKHADSALYVAKDLGRARFVVYEPSFSTEADRVLKIERELRNAIERDEFKLHYQPKVELGGDTVDGFEALLRWFSAELGFVGPGEFIPIAEERGMINEIGAWCLNEACRQIRVWQEAGFVTVPVSVNVSSAQFRDTDVERVVSDALVAHDVHPSQLELELTESLLLGDDEKTAIALRDLRAIGVRIALDDFGTGYSALTYLNRFPLDVVKMDRGFLRDIEDSSSAAGIASAVVSLSHSLGFEVVAEGVDSGAQADLLRAMDCDLIQGFLFSPAVPAEEATRFLASGSASRPIVAPAGGAKGTAAITGEGEIDPNEVTGSGRVRSIARPGAADPSSPPLILVVDAWPSTLGASAFRLMELEADVHLVTGLAEAAVFVQQEMPIVDMVMAPTSIELDQLGELMETIRKLAPSHDPRLLMVGEQPSADRRGAIRQTGADWILCEPYADPELRFFLNAARSNRDWLYQRQGVLVPIETIVWIRSGAQRGSGVMTSLSTGGAHIETTDSFEQGKPIRLEFKVDSGPISVFANVTRNHDEAGVDGGTKPIGIDVIFYEVDDVTDERISQAVERLWSRYRP